VVQHGLGGWLTNGEQKWFELRREPEVERAKTGNSMRICDVLDRRLHQPLERRHANERQYGHRISANA
jgi:hypothetical protein